MNHTELLNHLAAKHNLKSYLEIGVQNPANNFNKINCPVKLAVDPCLGEYGTGWGISGTGKKFFAITSDDFFLIHPNSHFDLVFIDGLHHADQVKRDFENSLRCLNDGGFIVIHDCLPEDEITTCVPRGNQKMWHGDVYKFTMNLHTYSGIDFITYNFDNGCCVIWKDANLISAFSPQIITWDYYKQNRKEYMNIKEWQKELV